MRLKYAQHSLVLNQSALMGGTSLFDEASVLSSCRLDILGQCIGQPERGDVNLYLRVEGSAQKYINWRDKSIGYCRACFAWPHSIIYTCHFKYGLT